MQTTPLPFSFSLSSSRPFLDINLFTTPSTLGVSGANSMKENKFILLTTTGDTADYVGHVLGIYREAGVFDGRPYYKQLSELSEPIFYVYHSKHDQSWKISDDLGGGGISVISFCGFCEEDTVPSKNWHHVSADGSDWVHDSDFKLKHHNSDDYIDICEEVYITAFGEADREQSSRTGV